MSENPNPYESPAVAPDDPDFGHPPPESDFDSTGFHSARTWGILACVGLGINLFVSFTLFCILVGQLIAPDFFEDTAFRSSLDPIYSALFAAIGGARIATAIPFLVWEYTAYRNLTVLGHHKLEAKKAWVVLCWFIPIMNWFCPYQVMSELYSRSHPDADVGPRNSRTAVPVNIWWGAWLLATAIGIWTRYSPLTPGTFVAEYIAYYAEVAYMGAATVSAIGAIYLVSKIDRLQLRRYSSTRAVRKCASSLSQQPADYRPTETRR